MKLLERLTIIMGLTFAGMALVYRYVLTDEQRAAIQEGKSVVSSATREVTDIVSPLVSDGPTKSEEEAAYVANRARTAAQWEALGY